MIRALVVVVFAVFATDMSAPPQLLAVDTVPTVDELTNSLGSGSAGSAATSLVGFATKSPDIGVRLHAIHGLVNYCTAPCADSDPVHAAARSIYDSEASAKDGADALLLRAAIESLGEMGDPNDVGDIMTATPGIEDQLSHPSRDIRAAAARALAAIGSCNAVQSLRNRAAEETIPQVQLAIADALRILSPPKCP